MGITGPNKEDSNENVINDNYITGKINVLYKNGDIQILNFDKRKIPKIRFPLSYKKVKIEEIEYLSKNCEIFINGKKKIFVLVIFFQK